MSAGRILHGLGAVRRAPHRAVVTIGMFDGVHVAHQRVLRSTVALARRIGGTSVAITFDPDPQTVLDPSHPHASLMPIAERINHVRALGVEWVWVIPFTTRFARVSANAFVRRILVGTLHADALVVGEGFLFGRARRGDLDVLERLGSRHGMRVVPVRRVIRGGAPVSSSRIRRLISAGRLAAATRLLGRAPALYGVVVPGAGRGCSLGAPTANLRMTSGALPPHGVYAVRVYDMATHDRRGATPPPLSVRSTRTAAERPLACGKEIGGGVMNLGVRPTFGAGPVVCEVHLLDFRSTLLGHPVRLSLILRLRSERCFPSLHALTTQIQRDIVRARRILRARAL